MEMSYWEEKVIEGRRVKVLEISPAGRLMICGLITILVATALWRPLAELLF